MRKKVLVYPCGTEIGLEIFKAVNNSIHFELFGGSSSYDHGRFVYHNHLEGLPFITDNSTQNEITEFIDIVREYEFDLIYPAMDGVIYAFSKFKNLFPCEIIVPEFDTVSTIRSKRKTYKKFQNILNVPVLHSQVPIDIQFPLFIKPNIGQGSVGARVIKNREELDFYYIKTEKKNDILLMEYLPGEEYTIDCFTNNEGRLVYFGPRERKRIKNGISVNCSSADDPLFEVFANCINSKLVLRGGWFFQLKRDNNNELCLLEVACRIAGTSSFARNLGINLPLLTLFLYQGHQIQSIIKNDYVIELDRALSNTYKNSIEYSIVYVDLDDTLVIDNRVNTALISFLYQCINNKIVLILLTKHQEDLAQFLATHRLDKIFDRIIQINPTNKKIDFINPKNAILIDDSFGERAEAYQKFHINVFDTHMIECLME